MTEFLFPDNTVLCNFAAVGRLDLLKTVLNGRGRWAEAVAFEAGRSAQIHPVLNSLKTGGWMGDAIEITDPKEVQEIERIRRAVFGGTDERPTQHLGEAQTCYLIQYRTEFTGSWWISDDREALRYARFQGITTRETIDLISTAVVNGDIPADDAFQLMLQMQARGRYMRQPASPAQFRR